MRKKRFVEQEQLDEIESKIEMRISKHDEPSKEYADLLELKKAVSKTRLNRINASNRLLITERFLQNINIYYSCFTSAIAILGLKTNLQEVEVWSAILTVILAISIVYLNAQKYGSRAQELQTNYIALHKLLFDIQAAISSNDTSKNTEFIDRYCELLQTSENHTKYDHLCQMIDSDNDLSTKDRATYILLTLLRYILRSIFILLPIWLSIRFYILGAFRGIL